MIEFPTSRGIGIQRRRFVAAMIGSGILGAATSGRAQAAWKPNRPIRLVVPFPAGGGVDVMARMLTTGLSEKFGQAVVVDNKVGATGSIASNIVYSAKPDGMTLLVTPPDPIAIFPHLSKTPYDPTKFTPVASLASVAFCVLARPGLPVNNLQDLIHLARAQTLTFGNAGTGGSLHLMSVAFARAAKIDKVVHVPYLGSAPQLQAVMADQVDVAIGVIGGVTQLLSKMKLLAVTSEQRVAAAPDCPTLKEQGIALTRELWQGIFAPPNMPDAITSALSTAIREVAGTEAYQAKTREYGSTPMNITQPEFARHFLEDYRSWGELVRSANVKAE
jgi:tripartite-type tricarboxylate transporter receptor subunit TctC